MGTGPSAGNAQTGGTGNVQSAGNNNNNVGGNQYNNSTFDVTAQVGVCFA